MAVGDGEMVDQLGFSRTLTDLGQVFLTDQSIDQGGLAYVGSADECEFGAVRRRAFLRPGTALDESGLSRAA